VTPSAHESGRTHVISTALVSRLSGRESHKIHSRANDGACFISLSWEFPGVRYPSYTTRHLLTERSNLGELSFSGGLDWARRISKNTRTFQPASFPDLGPRPPLVPALPVPDFEQKFSLQHSGGDWPNFVPEFESLPADITDTPRSTSPEQADDQLSECSELASETTISEIDTETLSSRSFEDVEYPDSSGVGYPDSCQADDLAQSPITFPERRQIAEAMYIHNGDTSGLLSLLASMASSGGWQPSGIPRF
jgi:hypothetical protein